VDTNNPTYAGNKSTTVTVAGGATYGVAASANSAVLTLLDNAYPNNPVLLADPLTDSVTDPANWVITYGDGDMVNNPGGYEVDFGYNLITANGDPTDNGYIGLPPSGATNALRITCNKNLGSGSMYGGGVNVYLTNMPALKGNYAVRFNMNLVGGDNTFSVEGVMFGINHNATGNPQLWQTNWWLGNGSLAAGSGPWDSDGNWYWIQTPPAGYGGFGFNEFEEYTGATATIPGNGGWQELASTTASTYQNVFKGNLFTAVGNISGGTPANNSPVSATPKDNTWSDVEIKQVNGVITMSIDQTPIFTNSSPLFTSGYLMLGYDCPIQGIYNQYIGTPDAAAYFSNLRVVSLEAPTITSIVISGANVVIQFTSPNTSDTTASFALTSASVVNGVYSVVSGTPVFTSLGSGLFQVTYPTSGSTEYYRILRTSQ